jgi:DNA polymerase III subunit beta
LNGALLVLQPGTITMVATDGHRLAHIQAGKADISLTDEMRVLIPRKALAEINSLLGLSAVDILEFVKDESYLYFRIGSRLLTSRQLTGTFANYEAVMPKEYSGTFVLGATDFTQAIQRVAQFSDERSNSVRLKAEANQLYLASSSTDTGESEEILDTNYGGSPIKIGFNSKYLLDFMKVAGTEKVSFHFKDGNAAAEFRPADAVGSDINYRYVVMPMRT